MVVVIMTDTDYESYASMEAAEDAADVAAYDAAKADPANAEPLSADDTACVRGRTK